VESAGDRAVHRGNVLHEEISQCDAREGYGRDLARCSGWCALRSGRRVVEFVPGEDVGGLSPHASEASALWPVPKRAEHQGGRDSGQRPSLQGTTAPYAARWFTCETHIALNFLSTPFPAHARPLIHCFFAWAAALCLFHSVGLSGIPRGCRSDRELCGHRLLHLLTSCSMLSTGRLLLPCVSIKIMQSVLQSFGDILLQISKPTLTSFLISMVRLLARVPSDCY
jgi:hypothetical protein